MQENDEELWQRIVGLLVEGGYSRARISSLPPLDTLIGGLTWCIFASDGDLDYDLFYDDTATLDHKIKGCKAIESALQKMECPHPLQAYQIQGLDYRAVYRVVEWLVGHVLVNCGMLPNQVFSYAARNGFKEAGSRLMDHINVVFSEEIQRDASHPPLLSRDAPAGQQEKAVGLLKQIAEEEKHCVMLQEQRKVTRAQLKRDERYSGGTEIRAAFPDECIEGEGGTIRNARTFTEVDELQFQGRSEKERVVLLETVSNLVSQKQLLEGSKDWKAEIEDILQQDRLKLKLLEEEMARKNQKFMSYRWQLDEIPSPTELMQYEQGFVQLYLQMQTKLQETRGYYANYNALAEANELTEKEISLLNSISVQFQDVVMSQAARAKFLASISDIAKGVHQKVEKLEARLLQEENVLSGLKESLGQLAAERRRYVNLMKALQEECAKNEELQNLERLHVASIVAIK